MSVFLIELAGLSAVMTVIILATYFLRGIFRKKFNAFCRYLLWIVIILRLCVPVGGFGQIRLVNVPIPEITSPEEELPFVEQGGALVQQNGGFETPDKEGNAVLPDPDHEIQPKPNEPVVDAPVHDIPDEKGDLIPNANGGVSINSVETAEKDSNTVQRPVLQEKDNKGFGIPQIVFAIWLTGALLSLVIDITDYRIFLRKVENTLCFATDDVHRVYEELCGEKHIKRAPSLYTSSLLGSPMLIGLRKPIIVIPDIDLDDSAWRDILSHELTHYTRKDLWVKLGGIIASAVHWFNPVVSLAIRMLNEEMELSCDEKTLKNHSEEQRIRYGSAMVNILKNCEGRANTLTTHFNPNKKTAKGRLESILDSSKKNRGIVLIPLVLVMCLAAGMVFGCSPEKQGGEVTETLPEGVSETTKQPEDNTEIPIGKSVIKDFDFSKRLLERIRSENTEMFEYYHSHNALNTEGLPIYKFETYEQWENYGKIFGTDYFLLKNMTDDYSEEYFEDHVLFAVYTVLSDGDLYGVDGITVFENKLSIAFFKYHSYDTDLESHRFYMVGLKKDDVKHCTEYYAYEKEVESNSCYLAEYIDDPKTEFLKALINKDYKTLERLSNLPSGTFESYGTLKIKDYTAYVVEERVTSELQVIVELTVVDPGETAFFIGPNEYEIKNDVNGCYIELKDYYAPVFLPETETERYLSLWLNDPWFDHEPKNMGEEYKHLDRAYEEWVYRLLSSFLIKQPHTVNELRDMCLKYGEEIFGITDYAYIDKVFKYHQNGIYTLIDTPPKRSTVYRVIMRGENCFDVLFYADRGRTVKSHLVRLFYDPDAKELPFGLKCSMVTQSEFEPFRYYF